MRAFALLGALVSGILTSSAVATPTSGPNRLLPHGYHAQAFARKEVPVNASASASANDTTNAKTIKHPAWPAHSLRVKPLPPTFCEKDPHVRSWAGYLDVDLDKLWESYGEAEKDRWAEHPKGVTEHFYFVFFEARNHAHDDMVLWLNGGPGCSSFFGLLIENGPCKVQSKGGTANNPFSWSEKTPLLVLDQPIGAGFSYASWTNANPQEPQKKPPPGRVFDSASAARDASAFLHLLALHNGEQGVFPGGKLPKLHIAGESYAGRYIPLLANRILLDNDKVKQHPERGLVPLPLTSILIGNGWVSPTAHYPSFLAFSCDGIRGHPGPFLNKTVCDAMRRDEPTCSALLHKCNLPGFSDDASFDVLACQMANDYCGFTLEDKYLKILDLSPYDWRRKATPNGILPEEIWMRAFLNDRANQVALGVDKASGEGHNGTWVECSDSMGTQFYQSGDVPRDSTWALKEVLEKGLRTLIYYGVTDYDCNYLAGERWTHDLVWAHANEWRRAPTGPWYGTARKGKPAVGEYKDFGGLTFAQVYDAGHFVPYDQPAVALDMLHYWLYGSHPGKLEP